MEHLKQLQAGFVNRKFGMFIKGVTLLRFNTAPLGAVGTGGAGDLFPRIRKDFKDKSSIPAGLALRRFITDGNIRSS